MKLAPWPRPLRLLRLKLLRLRRPPFSGDEAREICMEAAQRKKDKITTKYISCYFRPLSSKVILAFDISFCLFKRLYTTRCQLWLYMQILHYFEFCSTSLLGRNSKQCKICISQHDSLGCNETTFFFAYQKCGQWDQ